MENQSEVCRNFVDGIAHPNEKVLAEEILQGKKVGEFSLDFDQSQVDAMTERLQGAGCFDTTETPAEEVDEEVENVETTPEDENKEDILAEDEVGTPDAVEITDAPQGEEVKPEDTENKA